jgi:hypothetical protein
VRWECTSSMQADSRDLVCWSGQTQPLALRFTHALFSLGTFLSSVDRMAKKRLWGCAHLFRPMYAGANMGHPSDFLRALLTIQTAAPESASSLRANGQDLSNPVRFAPRFATMQPPASEGGVPGVG